MPTGPEPAAAAASAAVAVTGGFLATLAGVLGPAWYEFLAVVFFGTVGSAQALMRPREGDDDDAPRSLWRALLFIFLGVSAALGLSSAGVYITIKMTGWDSLPVYMLQPAMAYVIARSADSVENILATAFAAVPWPRKGNTK